MSRSRKSTEKTAATQAVAPLPQPSRDSPPPPAPRARAIVGIAAGLALAWTLTLAALGWTTANPALVSGAQIDRADAVVVAKLIDPAHNRVQLERTLFGRPAAGDEITVLNLSDARRAEGEGPFLLPLTAFREDYLVTVIEGQRSPPLVYPATPEFIERAKELVREKIK